MATLLRRLRLKRVSLVDAPANQHASVVLFKSSEPPARKMQPTASEVHVDEMVECKGCGEKNPFGAQKCQKCDAPMDMKKQEDAMDEKLKADLDAAAAKVAEAAVKIEALTKERDELQKRLDTPEEIEKRKLAALPESVRKQLEDQAAEIRKMRDDKSEAEQIEFVKSAAAQLPGKFEETGKLLKRVKDVVKAEDFEALTTMLKAASAQIEKGELFREIGKRGDGPVETHPLARIEQLVSEKIAKQADLKKADAINMVLSEHPELYAAYSRSVVVGANADAN